jgi:uncharacterized protein (TIGR03435 family)
VRRILALFVFGLVALVTLARVPVRAQSAARPLAFEVASVKVNNSLAAGGSSSGPTPGRFTITNVPLRFILLDAYQLLAHQLIGTPEWASSTSYDIVATYPSGSTPSEQDVRMMVQALLRDRFKLVVHRETRELSAYALTLARKDGRLGPQIARSDVDCAQWLADKRPQIGAGGPSPVAPGGKRPACLLMATRRFLTAGTKPMSELAVALQSLVGRPVVDQTGLTGAFDMDLQWTPSVEMSATPNGPPSAADDGASIFTALQEQLGLKLEPTNSSFNVLVVDHVEQPTPD